jgi:taurine dioxygenase
MSVAAIEVEPLSPVVGAAIRGVDWRQPVDARTADSVRAAFTRYSILCFPGQKLTPEQQLRFANIFGKGDGAFRKPPSEDREGARARGVMLVTNIRKNGKPVGFLPDGEMQFHSDGAHRDIPYRATTLYAIKIPSRGGETLFANLAASYEALSPAMPQRLEGLQTKTVYLYDAVSRDETQEDDPSLPSAVHSLVKTHPESGRRSLYLSRLMTRFIVGMERAESDALLAELFAHCERPEFVYAHRWNPEDLVIWDNRCLNHARADFPADETRLLRRYTVSEPD